MAIEKLCRSHGFAYMASVSRLVDNESIIVACTGGTTGQSRVHAQMLIACCETLTAVKGLTVEDLESGVTESDTSSAWTGGGDTGETMN